MKCSNARRLFAAYWDDETTQAERDWLEGHFSSCGRCRAEYEEYARTLDHLGRLPRLEAAPDLAERVLARVRRAPAAPDRLPAVSLAWVPATAAAVAILLIGATVLAPWLGRWTHPGGGQPELASLPVRQPVRVERPAAPAVPAGERAPRVGTARHEADQVLASIPDSLFDHSADVEFILTPVTLHRGRPAVSRPVPAVEGRQATLTF